MSTTTPHLDRLLDPIVGCLSLEGAARLVDLKADEVMQARIDYLADRSTEGVLTPEEREEYVGYVQAIDVIGILQAKARLRLRDSG